MERVTLQRIEKPLKRSKQKPPTRWNAGENFESDEGGIPSQATPITLVGDTEKYKPVFKVVKAIQFMGHDEKYTGPALPIIELRTIIKQKSPADLIKPTAIKTRLKKQKRRKFAKGSGSD